MWCGAVRGVMQGFSAKMGELFLTGDPTLQGCMCDCANEFGFRLLVRHEWSSQGQSNEGGDEKLWICL